MAYPNNHVPSSAFDPASVAFEKVFPTFSGMEAAGKIGGTFNYFQPTTQFYDEYIARVDHAFSDKDHLFGHYYSNYFVQAADYNPAMLSSYRSYFNTRYQNALLSETHTFTNNLLNNLILNYQREVALRGGPPGSTDMTDFGVKNIWQPATGPYMANHHHRLLLGVVLGLCSLVTQQLHLQRRPALDQGLPQLRLRRSHRAEQVRRHQRIPVVRSIRFQLPTPTFSIPTRWPTTRWAS